MRLVVQRASSARVEVGGQTVGAIGRSGLLVLVGVTHTDDERVAARLAEKVWNLRILSGERSCAQEGAPILVVSQFTLVRRPQQGPTTLLECRRAPDGQRTAGRGVRHLAPSARRRGGHRGLRRRDAGEPGQRRAGHPGDRLVISCSRPTLAGVRPRRAARLTSTSDTEPRAATTCWSSLAPGARVRRVQRPSPAKNRKWPVAEVGTSAVNSPPDRAAARRRR